MTYDSGSKRGDNPILTSAEDQLDRTDVAEAFAKRLLATDVSNGIVCALYGTWGTGKTSFINLARPHFISATHTVVDFNPWLFSGTESLVASLLSSLAAQLRVDGRLATLANEISAYARNFLPLTTALFGPLPAVAQAGLATLSELSNQERSDIWTLRRRIENALRALDKPILVILDDIDRLTSAEIRDVFRFVRLVGNFPNIGYLLAFDHERVEAALSHETHGDGSGRAYLEKIVQLGFTLPQVSAATLDRALSRVLIECIHRSPPDAAVDDDRMRAVYHKVIAPIVRSIRDIRRFAIAVSGAIETYGPAISLPDVLAMEAVRVFRPKVFECLHRNARSLTTISGFDSPLRAESKDLRAGLEEVFTAAGEEDCWVRDMVSVLFPAAEWLMPGGMHWTHEYKGTWLKARRVAHEYILRRFLEGTAPPGLQDYLRAEQLLECMEDEDSLRSYAAQMTPADLYSAIHELAPHGGLTTRGLANGLLLLLAKWPETRNGVRSLLFSPSRLSCERAIVAFLKAAKSGDSAPEIVAKVWQRITTLSGKSLFLGFVGHQEDVGFGIIPADEANKYLDQLRDDFRAASATQLSAEVDLVDVWRTVSRGPDDTIIPAPLPSDPCVTTALLRSSVCETRNIVGEAAGSVSYRFAWELLVLLCGGEASLLSRLEALRDSDSCKEQPLADLVDRYLSGERPTAFDKIRD